MARTTTAQEPGERRRGPADRARPGDALRWGVVATGAAVCLTVSMAFVGVGGGLTALRIAVAVVFALAVAAFLRAALASPGLDRWAAVCLAGAALAGVLGTAVSSLWLVCLGVGALLGSAGAVLGVVGVAGESTVRPDRPPAPPVSVRTVVLLLVAHLAVVALGTLDVLVFLPLATAPGFSLGEIHAALGADLAGAVLGVTTWAAVWLVAAVTAAAAMLALRRHGAPSTRTAVGWMLASISASIFFLFWAGFAMGNGVSDALPPYAGTASAVGTALSLVGTACTIGALVAVVAPVRAAARRTPRALRWRAGAPE